MTAPSPKKATATEPSARILDASAAPDSADVHEILRARNRQIAAVQGAPESTVKTRLALTLRKLERHLTIQGFVPEAQHEGEPVAAGCTPAAGGHLRAATA